MPKYLLIEFDKAGAEWVVVAYLSGDQNMLRVIEEGKDPHVVTGALISGAPEEYIIMENEHVGHNTDPNTISEIRAKMNWAPEGIWMPRNMSIRQAGKKCNHGLNYNMKYRRFALETEMDEADAKVLVSKYHNRAYPGIKEWHEQVRTQLQKDRTLINCFGRKRRFLEAWGDELFDSAYAFVPQSTIFDTNRICMVRAWADESKEFEPLEQIAQVHDSCLYQYPAGGWNALSCVLHRVATVYMNPEMRYGGRSFHIDTTIKIGLNWSDAGMHDFILGDTEDETAQRLRALWDELNERKAA